MTKRSLSQSPSAIRARERRLDAFIAKCEKEWNAEVKVFLDKGLTFDEAWVAAGGLIIPDVVGSV